ncbi:MAG: tRNA (adenosine(37)-N6)-dimethylallyltransferase MiaA, partial [Clostridia bacterium]|nr:tRNA (adenosine(37)-N6)-dimethylallyltransferase MiaA [Clostridia bacterium]
NMRVDKMIDSGLIEEVKALLSSGITRENQCMQGIGYKEVCDYLDGKISKEELAEVIKLNTRHYAKRQITFFKRLDGIKYLAPMETRCLADQIVKDFL